MVGILKLKILWLDFDQDFEAGVWKIFSRLKLMLLKNIAKGTTDLRDVNACPYGLGHFFPRPNGQFLILGGFRTLARMVFAFLAHFGRIKDQMKKRGLKKVPHDAHLTDTFLNQMFCFHFFIPFD